MIPLTIWMNIPSHYQSGLFRALMASNEVDLQVIFSRKLTQDRKELGWYSDLEGIPHRFLDDGPLRHLQAAHLAWEQRHRFHIVNGVWAETPFTAALVAMRSVRGNYAIYSEARNPSQDESYAKHLIKNTLGRWLIRGAAGALTISHLAINYYVRFGLRDEQVYPFGYFESSVDVPTDGGDDSEEGQLEVVFIGQLIPRKGVDLVIEAMRPLFAVYPRLQLTLIGEGTDRNYLEHRTADIRDRVAFEGVVPSDRVRQRLARADLLVLPSRFDGWGIVVNEAFSVGVPVIVSDRCGASELIAEGQNGYVFKSEDVTDLGNKLSEFLSKQEQWSEFKAAAAHTGKRIAAENTAPYLVDCVKHMLGMREKKPAPPWKSA